MEDKESFLSRWSRRKLEANENPPAALPQAEQPAVAAAAPPAPVAEPGAPDSTQGASAEYQKFFDPRVDEKLRRTALKKMFSEPHFNVMDGLDTYIDDYSIADPIPEAMLRQLNQAKNLFLFEDEEKEKTDESAGDDAVAAGAAPALPVAGTDTSTLPRSAAASATDTDACVASGAAAAPPATGSRNV